MSVAIYVTNEREASTLIPWGGNFARATHSELVVILPKRSKGKVCWNELRGESTEEESNALEAEAFAQIREMPREQFVLKQDIAAGMEKSDHDRVAISVLEIESPTPERTLAEGVSEKGISLLLAQADEPTKSNSEESSRVQQLFDEVPCETLLIRGKCPSMEKPVRIMIATGGQTDLELPLKRARQLAKKTAGIVTVLYVRPNDDEVAHDVAVRNLKRLMKFDTDHDELFERKIELADSLLDGVKRQNLDEFDLVIAGSKKSRVVRQLFRELEDSPDSKCTTAVAVMRKGVPLTSRLWGHIQSFVRGKVPQIERDQRIELFDQLNTNSRFNFDFIALISLSTAIAGLGLIDNSAAVVIGAMLVAPLMTPLLGTGFSLVQGNPDMVKIAMRSVVFGFAVALGIGVLLGLCIPGIAPDGHLNSELSSRCEPNLLHLIVAFVSGIAGAYATGRRDLVGALPGVAIAAALVPPIATSGIAFAIGEFKLSGGALLLFFTNIIAIVLGTAITFWAMGVNPRKAKSKGDVKRWPIYLFGVFAVISLLLAILLPSRNGIGADNTFGIEDPPENVTAPANPDEDTDPDSGEETESPEPTSE